MKRAMIFAAGLGTRLAPLTNDRPKALVELNGRSLLWHVVERLAGEGFRDLTVNVHHFAQQIKDYVASGPFADYAKARGLRITISDETDQLLDTGGGLKKAVPLLFADGDDSPVLIHNVDIMSNAHLGELYEIARTPPSPLEGGDTTSPFRGIEGVFDALLLVSARKTSRYLLFNDQMRLVGWQNVQTGEVRSPYPDLDPEQCRRLAFSGIHVVGKSLVEAMRDWPDKFGITDFYVQSCRDLNIRGFVQADLQLTDIGKIEVLQKLEGTVNVQHSTFNLERPMFNVQCSMFDEIDVSLIIPVHNRKELLPRLFDGLRRISGCNAELIFVDNNSDAATHATLQAFVDELNAKRSMFNVQCSMFNEQKPGAAAARNCGLDHARGEYVYFFDSDDELTPAMLPAALALARKEQADIVAVQVNHAWPDGRITPRPMKRTADPRHHIVANNFATQSLFMRRDFALRHGRWNETLFYWNDFELAVRLLLASPKIAWLPGTYHKIYRHPDSITGHRFADHIDHILAAHKAVEEDIKSQSLKVPKSQSSAHLLCDSVTLRLCDLKSSLNRRKALYAGHVRHEGDKAGAHLIYNSIDRSAVRSLDHLRLPLLYRLSALGLRGIWRLA